MLKPNKIASLLQAAQEDGVDVVSLCESAGIKYELFSKPDLLLEEETARQLLCGLAKSCSVDFPMRHGAKCRLLDLGVIGHTILSARSMKDVIEIWAKYSDVIGHPIKFTSGIQGDFWVMDMAPRFPMPEAAYRFMLEETVASHLPLGRDVGGTDFDSIRYEFAVASGASAEHYSKYINQPVSFNSKVSRSFMDADFYHRPVLTANEEVRELCSKHCASILESINSDKPLANEVKAVLLRSRGQALHEHDVAVELGLSVRSLHRKLTNEGESFQKLTQDYRRDYAFELLKEGLLQVKEIAYILGYSNASSFRRAFRAWTNQSITDWKADQTG